MCSSFFLKKPRAKHVCYLSYHASISKIQLSWPVVITGPSENGIGAESAITLASANPRTIILVGRTESNVTSVIEAIRNVNPSIEVFFVEIDLLDNKSVRQAAEKIKSIKDKIHVLINNAGVMAVRSYVTSADGVESKFAANYLGHFFLTNLLAKEILAAAGEGARIVQVGSLGYQLGETNLDDINFQVSALQLHDCIYAWLVRRLTVFYD